MTEIDQFSIHLLEQAKRFLEKARTEIDSEGKMAYLNASLLIGVSALEAHINAIIDELLSTRGNLEILELSLLSEKEINFNNGEFRLSEKLKMYRLIDRVEFVFQRFCRKRPLDKSEPWWQLLKEALRLRNKLVHPKEQVTLSEKEVEQSLSGILNAINTLYKSLFNSPYPGYRRGLDSNLSF
jgi:hypothetical protein